MINKTNFKRTLLSLLITLFVLLTGCGQKQGQSQPKPQAMQTEQSSDKIPEQLKNIETSIEEIIVSLNGPAIGAKQEGAQTSTSDGNKQGQGNSGGEQSQKGQQSSGSDQSQKGQQSSNSGGGQQGQGGQQAQTPKPTSKPDPWEKITPIINKFHYSWNSYMPLAVKKGASKTQIDNFSNALNSLTTTIISKNNTNTLLAASHLYSYIPDFYSLYKTKTSPEIKRIRYYTRNAMLSAMTPNWPQADTDINNLKGSWSLFKNTLTKDQQAISNNLDFSIYELEKVVKEKNKPLTDIKGRVVMSNIEAIEKSSEKGGSQGSQSGGQQQSGGNQSGDGGESGGAGG